MQMMIRGQKEKLSTLLPQGGVCSVFLRMPTQGMVLDVAAFGLDQQHKLSDERYMTFYNQPQSPCGAVRFQSPQPNTHEFCVDVAKLPAHIHKIVLTLSIDGAQTMRMLAPQILQLRNAQQQVIAEFPFDGQMFDQEKALMLFEFYKKDQIWRCTAVGQGFNGGLAALVQYFGGEVEASLPVAPVPITVSLEKKIEKQAPQLLSLAKKASVSLEKNKLGTVKAQVALVLDSSGSMHQQYAKGRVQEVINRLLPLAVHFDDDGSLECWAFGEKTTQLTSISLANVQGYVERSDAGWKKWKVGARYNEEAIAIKKVIDFYVENSISGVPVYILFISDGGIDSANSRKMRTLITQAATLPMFWQFVGIGGANYGILEQLDDLSGRVVDNCNFFALDDLHDVSEEVLYDRLLHEFPQWLLAAKQQSILS